MPAPKPLTTTSINRALRDIFGNTTLARAIVIRRQGNAIERFSANQVAPGEYVVRGTVQGTAPAPYETNVGVFVDTDAGDFDLVDSQCNCPVETECKHACALLLQWLDQWQEVNGNASPPDAIPGAASGASPAPLPQRISKPTPPAVRTLPVPGRLHEWLNSAINDDSQRDAFDKKAAPKWIPCVFYILTERAELHAVRGRQAREGTDAELTGALAKLSWLNYGHERPAHVAADDVALLRLILASTQLNQSRDEPIAVLSGEMGHQLLVLAVSTGRLYALSSAALAQALDKRAVASTRKLARPLAFGEARAATLVWREIVDGRIRSLRLAASVEGRPVDLIPTDPPFAFAALDGLDALEPAAHRIVPVSVTISAASLARLATLPPVPLDDAIGWAYVRDAIDALPDAATVPPLPMADETRLARPRAVLEFVLIEHTHQHGWGREARTETTIFPCVRLMFDYAGRRLPVSRQGLDSAIEVEHVAGRFRTTLARNVRAEMAWIRRMPAALLSAARVEYSLAQAAYEGKLPVQSLWALPHHDWAGQGAQVFADAQAAGFTIEVDAAFPLTLEDIPEPELELTPAQERGWFRIALGVTVQERRVDLAPALARLIGAQADAEAWLAALPEVPMVLLSIAPAKGKVQGTVVRLPGARVHALLAPVFDWFRGGEVAPLSGLQAALNADLPDAAVRYLGRDDKRWLALRDAVAAGTAFAPVVPHVDFQAKLRPYQLHGLAWLEQMRGLGMAAVLADDMGLGKTVQTLAFLHHRRKHDGAERPSLIIAPTSVTVNWLAEATRFVPDLKVLMHRGAARALDAAALKEVDLVVTSYPILQRDETRLAEIEWDVVVFDEAQTIKNAKAKTYQAAQSLNAAMRVALTGTPMENHLGELWALFNLLLPGLLGDLDSFNRVFRHPIEQRAASEQMAKLRMRIRPFLLRRTREQVLDDLPEKTEYTRWIELNPAQADLYESLRTAIHDW